MPASAETRKRVVATLYWKELRNMLQDAGGVVSENGLDVNKISAAAGTHVQTTKNLFNGVTVFPHYRTVWCNLAALGWRMSPVERPRAIAGEIKKFSAIGKFTRKKKGKKR